ncbi:hypothetical protein [Paracoccus simplex]|uniref:Uncharacterized protein n=1 Tax=Paracoccus simplex TaxID=2086346 RepID=A0ABV7RX15_9RHOB
MTSDIVSVEIGRSTWQGPAEEAPRRAPITQDDLVAALEQIEMLTATGLGLDPDTTMQVHLLAGIGRATHDSYAWFSRSDLCASGQQVRALELRLRDWQGRAEMAGRALEAVLSGKPVQNADEIISFCKTTALTPAPQPKRQVREEVQCDACAGNGEIVTDWDGYLHPSQDAPADHAVTECLDCDGSGWVPTPTPATPTAQEAVPTPVEWQVRYHSKWITAPSCWTAEDRANWPGEHRPLFAHPPQPSVSVADLQAAISYIDKGHDGMARNVLSAALRALKGAS